MLISRIRIVSFISSLILGLNLLSYTAQPYIPSSSEHSLSYTVENCPSHKNRNPASRLIQIFLKKDRDEGRQKHCFCSACDYGRFYFIKPSTDLLIERPFSTRSSLENITCLKSLITHLSIRAPPFLVV